MRRQLTCRAMTLWAILYMVKARGDIAKAAKVAGHALRPLPMWR